MSSQSHRLLEKPAYQEFRGIYTHRLRAEQEGMINALLNHDSVGSLMMLPAPEGCRTCYYLYGI